MKIFGTTSLLAISFAIPAAAASVSDGVALALTPDGQSIVISPDMTNPQRNQVVTLQGPSAGFGLEGIDYRPSTQEIYGYDDATDAFYLVDLETGALTTVAEGAAAPMSTNGGPVATTSPELDIDFNNEVDAARVIAETDENLVFFPEDFAAAARQGTVDRFTDAMYAEGDVNEGGDPQVVGNAYTNAIPNAPTTQQYVVLGETDSLGLFANNAGTVDTIGQILLDGDVLDVNQSAGLDFLSPTGAGDNLLVAQFVGEDGMSNLYTLDFLAADGGTLAGPGTVTASFVGSYDGIVRGLTVAPRDRIANVAPIPVPGAAVLLLGAFGGLSLLRRRKTA